MPDDRSRNEFVRLHLDQFAQEEHVHEEASQVLQGCSFADMEQIILKAKRKAIIEDTPLSILHIKHAFAEYKPRIISGSAEGSAVCKE